MADFSSSEDLDLVCLVQATNDEAAFTELIARHSTYLLNYIFHRYSRYDLQRAEDICQDAVLAAWTGISSFKPSEVLFRTWLTTIAINKAAEMYRHETAIKRGSAEWFGPLPSDTPDSRDNHVKTYERDDLFRCAWNRLDTKQQRTLSLSLATKDDRAEAAKIEGVALNTLNVRALRARVKLGQLMEELSLTVAERNSNVGDKSEKTPTEGGMRR